MYVGIPWDTDLKYVCNWRLENNSKLLVFLNFRCEMDIYYSNVFPSIYPYKHVHIKHVIA